MSRWLMELLDKIDPWADLWSAGNQSDTFPLYYYLFACCLLQGVYSPYNSSINLCFFPHIKLIFPMLNHITHFTEIHVDSVYHHHFFSPEKNNFIEKYFYNNVTPICHNSTFQSYVALSPRFYILPCVAIFFEVFSIVQDFETYWDQTYRDITAYIIILLITSEGTKFSVFPSYNTFPTSWNCKNHLLSSLKLQFSITFKT